MKKTIKSLLAVSALLVPLSGIALAPAAAQASPTPTLHQTAAIPDAPSNCENFGKPTKWAVNANNISIRDAPDGPHIREGIAKSATFVSDTPHGSGYNTCYTFSNGQYWIYGQDQAHPSEYGWVGCDYLDVLHTAETCPTYIANGFSS